MTWALTAVGVLSLAAVGGATIAGDLGGLVGARHRDPSAAARGPTRASLVEANQAIQNGAGWAALWLGVAVVAAIVGTLSGASATKGTAGERRPEHTRSDGARMR